MTDTYRLVGRVDRAACPSLTDRDIVRLRVRPPRGPEVVVRVNIAQVDLPLVLLLGEGATVEVVGDLVDYGAFHPCRADRDLGWVASDSVMELVATGVTVKA